MINPDKKFIFLWYFARNLIIVELQFAETIENRINGKPIPSPKNKKLSMLSVKLVIKAVLAKNAAINAGLQGITMAPKKNP